MFKKVSVSGFGNWACEFGGCSVFTERFVIRFFSVFKSLLVDGTTIPLANHVTDKVTALEVEFKTTNGVVWYELRTENRPPYPLITSERVLVSGFGADADRKDVALERKDSTLVIDGSEFLVDQNILGLTSKEVLNRLEYHLALCEFLDTVQYKMGVVEFDQSDYAPSTALYRVSMGQLAVGMDSLKELYPERYKWFVDACKFYINGFAGVETECLVSDDSSGSPLYRLRVVWSDSKERELTLQEFNFLCLGYLAYRYDTSGIYLFDLPERLFDEEMYDEVYDMMASFYDGQTLVATESPLFFTVAACEGGAVDVRSKW